MATVGTAKDSSHSLFLVHALEMFFFFISPYSLSYCILRRIAVLHAATLPRHESPRCVYFFLINYANKKKKTTKTTKLISKYFVSLLYHNI